MPTKGFFTQGAAILLADSIGLGTLRQALHKHSLARATDGTADPSWMGGFPSALVAMRPEVNGYVLVSIVPSSWPDHMGSPAEEQALFGAWAMGWLGPLTYPGNLARATSFARTLADRHALVGRHHAFLRVLSSYVLGAGQDAPVLPKDYDALAELRFVTDVARDLLELREALAYFNPAGETLHTAATLDTAIEYHLGAGLLPYPVWTCLRMLRMEQLGDWNLMDTVGLGQLDLADHEACFPPAAYDPHAVANFLRNTSDYVRQNGPVIEDGDTMDGPGGIPWQAKSFTDSLAPAPRPVIRWIPCDESEPPSVVFGSP